MPPWTKVARLLSGLVYGILIGLVVGLGLAAAGAYGEYLEAAERQRVPGEVNGMVVLVWLALSFVLGGLGAAIGGVVGLLAGLIAATRSQGRASRPPLWIEE